MTTLPSSCSNSPEAPVSRCALCRFEIGGADTAACSRCGVTQAESAALSGAARRAYRRARAEALIGRFAAAREHLQCAQALGFAELPGAALQKLCDSALGATPATGYETARRQAAAGEFDQALRTVNQALRDQPQSLPLHKLSLLCLEALGNGQGAESARRALLIDLPAEPDLTRWRFIAPLPAVPQANRLRDTSPAARAPNAGISLFVAGAATAALIAGILLRVPSQPPAAQPPAAIAAPFFTVRTAQIRETVTPPVPAAKTDTALLSDSLAAEWRARRRRADIQQARRWFNQAVRAARAGDYSTAAQRAGGAASVGRGSYLEDDALLLWAESLAARGQPDAAARVFTHLVTCAPDSPYASVAVRRIKKLSQNP